MSMQECFFIRRYFFLNFQRRFVSYLILCSLLCLLLTLFMPHAYAAQPSHGGTLIIAVEGEDSSLNPHLVASATAQPVINNIFNLLVYMDFNFEIIPGLARSWNVSKDGLTYTFNLAKNAAWHDGKPFTSADVLYSLKEIYPQNPRRSWWKPNVNFFLEAPDAYTFLIKLKEPFAPLLTTLAFQVTGPNILPKHLYEGTDLKKNPYNNKPIGTGPFMFKEWVKGSHIELVRNENYFARGKENKPYIDRLVFQIIPDSSARILALKKGEIDFIPATFVPLEEIAELRKDRNIIVDNRGGGSEGIRFLLFNLRHPTLSNKLVRQANHTNLFTLEVTNRFYSRFIQHTPPRAETFSFDRVRYIGYSDNGYALDLSHDYVSPTRLCQFNLPCSSSGNGKRRSLKL